MLVLTRKQAEMIQIGNDVVIKVIRTGRGSVKIGIEAPAHVRVLRAELAGEPTPAAPKTVPTAYAPAAAAPVALACVN